MKYNIMEIGSRIREERKKLGVNQTQFIEMLAERDVSICRNTLSDMENGKCADCLRIDFLVACCNIFNCDMGYILHDDTYTCRTRETSEICNATGLAPEAIKTLREYRLTGAFEGSGNPTAAVVSFLLRPEHCKRNSGGLLHLIGAYLTGDFSVSGFDEYIHTDGRNGSGFELLTSDVIRAAIPNMILQRLQEYRNEIQ